MQQRIELYSELPEARNAANELANDGWFVHIISVQYDEYLVVYRNYRNDT